MLLVFLLVLGFAYIVWANALRQTGVIKTIGQVVAVITVIVALITLIFTGFSKGEYHKCPWKKGKYPMMEKKMMRPYYEGMKERKDRE
jgi:hypothetical protein